MRKQTNPIEKLYMVIIFLFMYAPIVTLIVLSFNNGKSRSKWNGFTLDWYIRLFHDSAVLNALANTLIIALIATAAATVIGTLTCVALMGQKKKTRAVIMGTANIPMINADIVTGIALMLLFRILHMEQGFVTVLIAHITFNIPYVMLSVMPRMKTISPSVYEAALDLGAEPSYAFRHTILPDLAPAIFSGALMAFTMSIDDFIITYFTKGSGFDTLSTKIYNEVKRGIQPEIYALSALIFAAVLLLMFLSSRLRKAGANAGREAGVRAGRRGRSGSYAPEEDGGAAYTSEKRRRKRRWQITGGAAVSAGIIVIALLYGGVFSNDGNKVYIYNAGEYLDPQVVEMFEEETGIEVVYDEFESPEIMYAKLAADDEAYDVICPSDYMVEKLLAMDMLRPLDWSQLPNARENIGAQYYKAAESFDPGNRYAVPHFWGTVGILYNTDMVKEPVDSWDILWDPKYKGEILMQDSVRDAFMVALARRGASINSLDPKELEQAADDLIEQAPLVQAYVVDQVRDKMIGNEAALGVIYSGEAIYVQRENKAIEYVIPKEGSNVWIDAWCVMKKARNYDNAMKWIDFMCRPEIAYMNFDFITYSTPNEKGRALIEDEEIRNSPIAYPDAKELNRCTTYHYLGEEGDRLYSELWKKVKSADK